jgi:hypothetical protein
MTAKALPTTTRALESRLVFLTREERQWIQRLRQMPPDRREAWQRFIEILEERTRLRT